MCAFFQVLYHIKANNKVKLNFLHIHTHIDIDIWEKQFLLSKISCFIFGRTQNVGMSHCIKLGICNAGLWLSWRVSPWESQTQKKRILNKIKLQSYRAMCPDLQVHPKIIGSLNSQPGLVPLLKTNRRIGCGLAYSPGIPIILWIQCCEYSVLWY